MKKFILVFALFLFSCTHAQADLVVYNWGDYIDPNVVDMFEEESGLKVDYQLFETNEDMYIKVAKGGETYDVLFPSDYMIEKMIEEDLLLPLDHTKIPNLANMHKMTLNLQFDPQNRYSIPYMWGTVGILYNPKLVKKPVDSWDILWDKDYAGEIIMPYSQRDALAVALKKLGYSMNTKNIQELEEAKDALIEQKPLVLAYMNDNIRDAMVAEEGSLAVMWSGNAVSAQEDRPDLIYAIPKEGTNLWFDNVVIPKNAKHPGPAHQFINFLCREDIAKKNADYIGYSSPLKSSINQLKKEKEPNLALNPSDKDIINSEVFSHPGEILEVYDNIWTEVNAAKYK